MSENTFSAMKIAAVTPSDTVALEPFPNSLFVGGAGDIALTAAGGGTATLTVAAGSTIPIQASYVLATGTTATGIVALYN